MQANAWKEPDLQRQVTIQDKVIKQRRRKGEARRLLQPWKKLRRGELPREVTKGRRVLQASRDFRASRACAKNTVKIESRNTSLEIWLPRNPETELLRCAAATAAKTAASASGGGAGE